jgi:hypothetical protein
VTITEFLLARIAEDEATASAAAQYGARWHWDASFGDLCNDASCPYGMLVASNGAPADVDAVLMEVHGYDVHEAWMGADHIARHDPARVLAECAAKRAIVALGEFTEGSYWDALGALAAVHAGHPDYDPEWAL